MALERGARGIFGLKNAKIDPAKPSGRTRGLRMTSFDPGRALERGAEGEFGIENADFVPDSDVGKRHRLRIG